MWDPEELLKCTWHAFTALDIDHRGKVSKSQLKVLSLNLCNVMKIPFDPCVLEDHFKDDNTGPLSNQGYMRYLSNFILNKVKPQDDFATLELFKFCWTLSYRKNLSRHLHISHDDAFKVWCIFNFLSENKYPLFIVTQEVEYLLKLLTNAMGDVWSEGKLAEYHVELSLTKSKSLTASELIELVGMQLFKNKCPPALTAAISEVFEELILGILKQGYMGKKCHAGKNWKEHWFVLRPNYLEYYTSEDLMEIKGIVALGGNCTVESLPDKDRICALLIKSSDTSFEMSACDKTKKKEWLQAIQKCIQIQELGLLPPQRQACEKRRQQREMQKVTEDKVTELMRQLQANNESKQRELEALKKVHFEMEEQVAQKSSELQHCLHRVKDLEQMLEDERRARGDVQDKRKPYIRLLEERALERAELKQMQLQQQRALSQSQAHRKLLETQQRDLERQLQEAMQQLEKLKGQNHRADQQNQDVSQRLKRAVNKNLENKVATHDGLIRLIQPGQKGPLMITNWGPAAFTEAELELRKKFWQESRNWSATAE